jgi:hypothetical protein
LPATLNVGWVYAFVSPQHRALDKQRSTLGLLLLTAGAFAVHGYHPFAEDAEVYLPGVEKALHPSLFPVGSQFFEAHAGLSIFSKLIAGSLRASHIPFEYGIFLWQVACIFLFLLACWQLTGCIFESAKARWCGVALVAALLTMPVAGTALYIMDQYLNARNVEAFAAVFAVDRVLRRKYFAAVLWLLFETAIHPLMGAFTLSFCVLLVLLRARDLRPQLAAMVLPLSTFSLHSSPAYHEAARLHSFHYILNWEWYEWLGIIAPVFLFLWFARIATSRRMENMALICRALVIYDLVYFAAALIISIPRRFEVLARIQPLRSLHLLYILLLLLGGGLLADYVLKNRAWRWVILFLPMCAGMFFAQRSLFPSSSHIEWPWAAPKNSWAQAFLWIRDNTPEQAVFAIDPHYERIPGEETVGFRCMAQRSRLADYGKDSGPVSMFPPLAEEWFAQLQAQKNWEQFSASDLDRLRQQYGVSWVVLQPPGIAGLNCPYRNSAVMVCRLQP